jgi:hypothetical protein
MDKLLFYVPKTIIFKKWWGVEEKNLTNNYFVDFPTSYQILNGTILVCFLDTTKISIRVGVYLFDFVKGQIV